MENERFCEDGSAYLYEMNAQDGVDIDEELDLIIAEALLNRQ